MTVSIGAKVGAGIGFALAALALVGIVSYRSTVRLVETGRLVARASQVLESLEAVKVAAVDAETGVRGYVISGAEEFLDPYAWARRETGRTLATLRALTADDPVQSRTLDQLQARLADSLGWLEATIRLRRDAGLAPAVERTRQGDGKEKTDAIRSLVDEMETTERRILAQRSAAAEAIARQTIGIIIAGTVLALVFLVTGGALIIREIRGRQRAEDLIRASEARYRSLFDRIPIGLYRSTPDGRVLDANPAMAQMLGYPDTASLVAVAAPAVYADPDDRRRQVVERLARGGILKDVEIRWRRRDGEAIWVRTDVRGVQGPDGGVRYYEGAVQDITETRRVQDALAAAQDELVRKERLAVLGQLAGGVSHELRNPLGVIKNSVYYLRMVLPADDRVRKHLQILEREITTATRIVTDLLDFARVTPAVRVPVDVNELARDAVERNPFPGHVKVTLELCETPPPVLIDPDQIALVVGNLLRNAAQAMPDGGTLTVRTAAAGAGALVEVEDTGVGIPPERLDKIFEPLFTTKARGIGLGLPVARSLTEANGGRLLVQSEPGRGSRFTVRFAGAPEDG